jgi:hypothetical protein
MTRIAATSSTTAIVTRKSFTPTPTRSPSSARTPIAKAASVAIGIPQPAASWPPVIARKIAIGVTTPPSAAMIGSAAFFGWRRSPVTSSRLISSEIRKKKRVIRPSLTQWPRLSSIEALPMPMFTWVDQKEA